jgi:hypothetical protein
MRNDALRVVTDFGKSFSQPVIVSDDHWVLAGCPVSGPAIIAGANGALRVLWYSEGTLGAKGLYWSESRDAGKTFSPRRSFFAGQVTGTPVVTSNSTSNFNIAWTKGTGGDTRVLSATLDADGHVTPGASEELGELPASAFSRDRLIVAYISKPQEQRIVWLVKK